MIKLGMCGLGSSRYVGCETQSPVGMNLIYLQQVNAMVKRHALLRGRPYQGDLDTLQAWVNITVHTTALMINLQRSRQIEIDLGTIAMEYNRTSGTYMEDVDEEEAEWEEDDPQEAAMAVSMHSRVAAAMAIAGGV